MAGIFKNRYREKQSTSFSSVLDWNRLAKEPKFFKPPKNGEGAIDIVPYIIKSKNHPSVRIGTAEVGELDYALSLWIHRNVGAAKASITCLARNYNLPCPICEHCDERKKKYGNKDEEYMMLKATQRMFYNVLDASKEDSSLYVFVNPENLGLVVHDSMYPGEVS